MAMTRSLLCTSVNRFTEQSPIGPQPSMFQRYCTRTLTQVDLSVSAEDAHLASDSVAVSLVIEDPEDAKQFEAGQYYNVTIQKSRKTAELADLQIAVSSNVSVPEALKRDPFIFVPVHYVDHDDIEHLGLITNVHRDMEPVTYDVSYFGEPMKGYRQLMTAFKVTYNSDLQGHSRHSFHFDGVKPIEDL